MRPPTVEERSRTEKMTTSDRDWPLLVLPLKRTGELECAVLLNPVPALGCQITIILSDLYSLKPDSPTKTYTDVWAMIDDGWVVD